jgi:hypothetical protein
VRRRLLSYFVTLLATCGVVGGCHPPVQPPVDQRLYRYVLVGTSREGKELGRIDFGECLRGGNLYVYDKSSSYKLHLDPDLGLDMLNRWAEPYFKSAATTRPTH